MKSIYKYYKERLIEISGKNRSLYSKKISKKFSYDIGAVIGADEEEFDKFFAFLWQGKRYSYELIGNSAKQRLFKNFNLEEKAKISFQDTSNMSTEEKRNENLRRERVRREEGKKIVVSQISALKILKREIEEFARETGRYELFIGYPFVSGHINKDLAIKAPLLLFPVIINIENNTTVSLELKSDSSIQLNKVLILAYAKEHRLNTEKLLTEFDNLQENRLKNVDDILDYLKTFGFQFEKEKNFNSKFVKFDDIKETNFDLSPLKVIKTCVIGRYPLANSIYNDYDLLEKRHLTTPAIRQLLEARFPKRKNNKSKNNKKLLNPIYTINDLDFTQENAISQLNESGNMVIYGPPGTGKSQTIVNVISDALCKNKTVLVVSQKKAALEVVFNRLKNLNSKCMFVTDAEKNKTAFYERVSQMHKAVMDYGKDIPDFQQQFDVITQNLNNEISELETISNVLFTKTDFGLTLQEMYTNSAKIGKNSFDYIIYQAMLKNKDIMNTDYKTIYTALRVIKEKNKGSLYHRFIQLKKNNPLASHILPNVEVHTINQMKTYLKEIIGKNIVPFDTTKNPHARQLLVYMLENNVHTISDMKPLIKMLAQIENPKLLSTLNLSKILFPAYPFIKNQMNKKEAELYKSFESTLEEIQNYIKNYEIIEQVLDRQGYLMTIDNIINGNSVFIKLLLNALEDYLEIRDVNVALRNLTDDERIILNFAYENSKNPKQYKDIIDKLLEVRVYHEAIYYEEYYKNLLPKILDFENIRNRIISLTTEQKQISASICMGKFQEEYIKHFQTGLESQNYYYQITKQQGLLPLRQIMELYGDYLLKLFPCWLLSPESVSNIFPLKKEMFDIILFDEASQVFIENTLPTIYRGKCIVVAGDNKQLRPTATFVKRYLGNDSDEELSLATQAALEVESLLDLATARFDSTNLTYHYRSKNQELIDFSNFAFYDSKLQIAPNISKNIGEKPIQRIMVNGRWIGRRNEAEATAVAQLLKKLIKSKKNNSSIGIITFNAEQESAIEDAIDAECQKDSLFRDAFIREQNRKENNEDTSIFIKNLENVQGDERDIIIFSIGYARNEFGKVVAHFGPLSIEGGENRLNVAITRAKEKIFVVTSIEPEELIVENSKNSGPKILKSYLKYVRAVSNKKTKEAQFILDSFRPSLPQPETEIIVNQLENEIKAELVKLGYAVETNLGTTNYKISLAVYDKQLDRYLLGIECDYAAAKSSQSILERDVYRNKFLQSRGWNIMRVWSRDWWFSKEKVINKIVKAINENKKIYMEENNIIQLDKMQPKQKNNTSKKISKTNKKESKIKSNIKNSSAKKTISTNKLKTNKKVVKTTKKIADKKNNKKENVVSNKSKK